MQYFGSFFSVWISANCTFHMLSLAGCLRRANNFDKFHSGNTEHSGQAKHIMNFRFNYAVTFAWKKYVTFYCSRCDEENVFALSRKFCIRPEHIPPIIGWFIFVFEKKTLNNNPFTKWHTNDRVQCSFWVDIEICLQRTLYNPKYIFKKLR